jgi:hypothetical protein
MIRSIINFLLSAIAKLRKKSQLIESLIQDGASSGDDDKQISFSRKLISFTFGLLMGLIFYHSIFVDIIEFACSSSRRSMSIESSRYIRIIVMSSTSLVCGLMCSISIQFRSVFVLVWLEALGKAGRNLIKTFVIALLLAGPIANIIANTREVVRVFECSTFLTYNLSKTKFDLAVKPLTNAFTHMETNLSAVQNIFGEIDFVVAPIIREIEEMDRHLTRR